LNFHIVDFFRSLNITLPNALFALGAAVVSYILMHGALVLLRRRLGALSNDRQHGTVAQVLSKTLAHTGALAIVATAILIGLSVLDLPEPWNTRLGHLWFFTLGIQIAMFLHRAVKIGSVSEAGVSIAEGLSGNELVVLSAGPFLNPGQKIKPKRQAAR